MDFKNMLLKGNFAEKNCERDREKERNFGTKKIVFILGPTGLWITFLKASSLD